MKQLNEKISELEFERHEYVLKIKSQEDRLQILSEELQQSQNEVETLRDRFEAINSTQPEHTKLLAIMESDKVAASRAMSQNQEMKKQLDELELRFVQLTNDKAELRNLLDAEEFANKEMRQNYQAMEERIHSMDERFKYKDEEMIRLAHENTHLNNEISLLRQKLKKQKGSKNRIINGNGMNEKGNNINEKEHSSDDHQHIEGGHDHHHHEHDHEAHGHHEHDNHHHEHKDHEHYEHEHHGHNDHDHSNENYDHHKHEDDEDEDECDEVDECLEATESTYDNQYSRNPNNNIVNEIYTTEAMEKLQTRFTKLIGQVADLTDEKQRLEHLVLQLQGETETIGEYIALYQTQRRMLKQREYEKAAQMQLLQAEREQLREKIQILNNLVSSLGMPDINLAPINNDLQTNVIGEVNEKNYVVNDMIENKANDSQIILDKIHHIITEIEQNTKDPIDGNNGVAHTADHLKCCSGKFEVV